MSAPEWQEERDAIVAWLRSMAPTFQPSMDSKAALEFAADAIERGDHQFDAVIEALRDFGAASIRAKQKAPQP